MGSGILDYADCEKDVGIKINKTLNFTDQANLLYNRANQRIGLMKITCHYVTHLNKRIALYLTE